MLYVPVARTNCVKHPWELPTADAMNIQYVRARCSECVMQSDRCELVWAMVWVAVEASVELFVAQKGAEEGSCAYNGTEGAETVFHCFGEGLLCHKHL